MCRSAVIKSVHRAKTLFLFLLTLTLYFQDQQVFAQGRPPAKVLVSSVVRENVQDQMSLIGTVESWRTSRVASEASGRVRILFARRGTAVEKGDILAQLGASELLLKVLESEAKGKASIARLEKARDELKRAEKLMKASLVSEKVYLEAKHSLREMTENVAVNKAAQSQFEDLLSKKAVRAPFAGIVTRELVAEGEWLNKGGSVLQLVDASKVRILVDLPEKYVSDVKVGSAVAVAFDAMPGESFVGKIHALIPEADRAARLFPLEIYVENETLRIKEGMLSRVRFDLGGIRNVLTADKDAVIRKDGEIFLFVVAEAKALKRRIQLGQAKAGRIEVSGELREGDAVVIRGNERLRDGQAVQVLPK